MLGKLPEIHWMSTSPWQPLEYQFYALYGCVRWLWHVVPPSMLDHARRTESGDQSPWAQTKGRLKPPNPAQNKACNTSLARFCPKFQRCSRQIFWYIFLKDGGSSQRAKAWTCEHVFAPVFTDSGHQNCVQWRWVACAGLLVCKMVTLLWTENVQTAGHTSFFPSFACLKGAA